MESFIGLNVGGKIYMASRETLKRHARPRSVFERIVDESKPSARDQHGNYMIDRDGKMFRHVLNFMRSGQLLLPEGFRELSLLECEADFYQLGALKASIQQLEKADEHIGLNVGGRIFKTTRETLDHAPGSRFAAILSGEAPLPPRDEQGNYIFDRNSEVFSYVLEFLRCGHLALWWRNSGWDKLLADEAEFFRMPRLLAHIKSLWDLTDPYRSANVYVFHDQSRDQYTVNYWSKYEHDIRKLFAFALKPAYESCLGLRKICLLDKRNALDDTPGEIGAISFKLSSVDCSSQPGPRRQHSTRPTNVDELVTFINRQMHTQVRRSTSDERVDEYCVQYKFWGVFSNS